MSPGKIFLISALAHSEWGFFQTFRASYSRTKESHILKLRLDPEFKKTDIKVRLHKDGVLEIEWPRKAEGEEIPVE
jgi:hypothetical protein